MSHSPPHLPNSIAPLPSTPSSFGPPLASLRVILATERGLNAFLTFARQHSKARRDDNNQLQEWIFSRMFKVIELPERSLSRVYSEIELQSGHRMSCTMDPSFLDLFSQYRVDIFLLASVNMFPTFMESSEYQTWSIRERSHRTDEFSCQRYDSPIEGEGASEIFSHLHLQPQMIRDIVDGSWLKTVLRCIDRLPIAVTLVTANPDRSNFPLVYLNLAFTAMTGYEKTKVEGRSMKFLSPVPPTEPITALMATGKYHCAVMKHAKCDGSLFSNRVILKPLRDYRGVYRYMFSVHVDVSTSSACEIKLAEDLANLLPNILNIHPVDEDVSQLYKSRAAREPSSAYEYSGHEQAEGVIPDTLSERDSHPPAEL